MGNDSVYSTNCYAKMGGTVEKDELLLLKECILRQWFLWGLIFSSMVIIVMKECFRDKIIGYILFIIAIICVPDICNINLDYYVFLLPYYVIGYKYSGIYPKKYPSYVYLIVGCIAIVAWMGMLSQFNASTYIYNSGISICGKNVIEQLKIDIFRWCIGGAGCISLLSIMKVLNTDNERILSKIGRNTMGIYIISGYMNHLVLYKIMLFSSFSYLQCVVETGVMLCISYACVQGLAKNRYSNKWLLGGKSSGADRSFTLRQ